MRRGPHPMKAQRDEVRKTATALGHRLVRWRESSIVSNSSYSWCDNRGCGLGVHIDRDGASGNILEVECHAKTFGN